MRQQGISRRVLAAAAVVAMVGSGCAVVTRVSVDSAGTQGNDSSEFELAISGNGRYVAFGSAASNLVAGDTNDVPDIFLRDTLTGTTTRVSVDSAEAEADDSSADPVISNDGRYVAFSSAATDLVPGDNNSAADVFVRDTVATTTTRVNVDSSGAEADGVGFTSSGRPAISGDGRYVAFISDAPNLVAGDTNSVFDVFVRDTVGTTTTRVSVDSAEAEADNGSFEPVFSGDGRHVAFASFASNLVGGDANDLLDVFVRDTVAGTTSRVSIDSAEAEADGDSSVGAISSDGHYVAFTSDASNLVAGDTNSIRDVFVRDTVAGTTTRVSIDTAGAESDGFTSAAAMSGDGRYIAFTSGASDLVAGDTNGFLDVFVRDRVAGTTTRVSVDIIGAQGNGNTFFEPAISDDGRSVAFASRASNLVAGDTNGTGGDNDIGGDVFVRPNPVPVVSSVTPSVLPRGVATPVTITGANFLSGSVLQPGANVAISDAIIVNETTINATLTPQLTATVGARNLSVLLVGTGGPGFAVGLCAGCLTVS